VGTRYFVGPELMKRSICSERGTTRSPTRSGRYEIIIYWSDEDEAFVAEVPELPGCAAHGSTEEAALASAKEAISLWIETAQEFNDPVPEPKGRRLIFA